ncbi:MAG: hypothetical protein LBJ21_04605 [Acidobacteriota bacterium]|nr:hypothetical protein [Acidobacteriota bacterium]
MYRKLVVACFLCALALMPLSLQAEEKKDYNENPLYYLTDAELDKFLGVSEKTVAPKEYVRLIYFHRVPG